MYDLTKFTLQDMTHCGDALQQFGLKAKHVEELTDLMCRYFYEHLIDKKTGEKQASWYGFL